MQITQGDRSFTVFEGHEWFWKIFADGSWEPSTFRIFDKFLHKDEVMLDIGAWIGPTALYAAPKCKRVYAFEPDPVAHNALIKNIDLNNIKNIIPYFVAVSDAWKKIPFGAKNGFGDSMSSEIWAKEGGVEVPAVPFESLVLDLMPGFIKIDIEGGEKYIFDNMGVALETIKPTIHLSLHTPDMVADLDGFKKHITEGLKAYPYFYDENLNPIKLEDAFNVTSFNSIVATFTKL